jgi:hypothetical protein
MAILRDLWAQPYAGKCCKLLLLHYAKGSSFASDLLLRREVRFHPVSAKLPTSRHGSEVPTAELRCLGLDAPDIAYFSPY